ncbi:DUF3130 family protein, partial [Listeria monocytogenes]|uniref:DUF3130 family protein n=1 Tax=Listeria monocytogenes TaxID=1639 RepID=UPI001E39979C
MLNFLHKKPILSCFSLNCFTECSQKRCATGAIMRGKDIHREGSMQMREIKVDERTFQQHATKLASE